MLTPGAKRQRAEAASATLSRPFRSPAVRGQGQGQGQAKKPGGALQCKRSQPSVNSQPSQPPVPVSLDSLVDHFTRALDAADTTIGEVWQEAAKYDDQDSELPALIRKWREAGRLAAEEVYAVVAQRVAGAGGIQAWRAQAALAVEQDSEQSEHSERRGVEDEEEDDQEESEKEEQSQNFTMATMLASLNVEPDLLGYDAAEERWKD